MGCYLPISAPAASRFAQEDCDPMQKFFSLFKQEKAQTMAEYATVLTVITIFCLAGLALLAAASTGALERVAGLLT